MSTFIHPTAIVSIGAKIADDCHIGPYCIIGPNVEIGRGTKLHNNVTVMGRTEIGVKCEIYPYAVIGGDPQDLKHDRSAVSSNRFDTIIYGYNVIREYVTIHGGTNGGWTEVGNNNLLMVGCHVAHDCYIGSECILSNGVQLAGHVRVEDRVTIGGMTGVHQFVTINSHSFIAGMSSVTRDVLPFVIYDGRNGGKDTGRAINKIGLRRREFPNETIDRIQSMYELIRNLNPIQISIDGIPTNFDDDEMVLFKSLMEDQCCRSLFHANFAISRSGKGRVRESAERLKPMC